MVEKTILEHCLWVSMLNLSWDCRYNTSNNELKLKRNKEKLLCLLPKHGILWELHRDEDRYQLYAHFN